VDGERHGTEALAIFDELADAQQAARVLTNLGILSYYAGRWDEATDRYQRSAARYELAGDRSGSALTANNLAEILSDQGHFDLAGDGFGRALASWSASGFRLGVAVCEANLGRLAARRGDEAKAMPLLERALTTFEEIGSASFIEETHARLAEAQVHFGRPDAALRLLAARAIDLQSVIDRYPSTASIYVRSRGWAHLQLAEPEAARAHFEQGSEIARALDTPYELALIRKGLAAALRALGDGGAARVEAEGDEVLRRLGVVRLAPMPLPA
jgi:tetratricopeptide (TPR) repeat protein